MANTGLNGPYKLDADTISKVVTKTSAGAYALGKSNSNGGLTVHRIGRSDGDVADRLGDYIGQYAEFKFDYFSSAKAAFEKECNLYHDFNPPDNDIHPDRPDGTELKCPRCKALD